MFIIDRGLVDGNNNQCGHCDLVIAYSLICNNYDCASILLMFKLR